MITRTQVVAAAPVWVRGRLAGPIREAAIVHTGAHAVYVAALDGRDKRCIGLLSRSSSVVPCGLRTTLPDLCDVAGKSGLLTSEDVAVIGEGLLRVGAVDVHIGRTLDLSVPQLDALATGSMADRLRQVLDGCLVAVRSELLAESLELLKDADASAVPMLLGRGSGLTPVGDDVLAGWLATMNAAQMPSGAIAQSVAALSVEATTLLSATLLDRASAGDVLPEFRRLLLDLRAPDSSQHVDQLRNDVSALLTIGHTSGAGLLLGSLLAFDHLYRRSHRS